MTSTSGILPTTTPASGVRGPAQGRWTYDDYVSLPDDGKRYEVVEGVLYMTPAPNIRHQEVILCIAMHLYQNVHQPGLGMVLFAPVDVELAPNTVVQPDVLVVLNSSREILTVSRIVGAPDLVVEVSSPSTATHDRRGKMDAYARAGVSEYWIVDPAAESVDLFHLEGAAYESAGVIQGATLLPSRVLPDFPVRVEQFFA